MTGANQPALWVWHALWVTKWHSKSQIGRRYLLMTLFASPMTFLTAYGAVSDFQWLSSKPTHGIEPWTFSLRMKCSTTELCGLYHSIIFLTHHICSTWFPMTFLIAHTGWRWYSMTFLTAHTQYSNHGIYITNKILYHWAIWALLRVEACSLHNFYSWMVWKILCTHSCLQSYVFAWMRMFSNLQTLTFSLCRKKNVVMTTTVTARVHVRCCWGMKEMRGDSPIPIASASSTRACITL